MEPKTLFVADIKGIFNVPSYQRGFRWGKNEVVRLLEDIFQNGDNDYCLQPIVLKRTGEGQYDILDGQQRLTALYLISRDLKRFLPKHAGPKYSLTYSSRQCTEEFLRDLPAERCTENPDFWFMYLANKAIAEWFDADPDQIRAISIQTYLVKHVKIIWYEVDNEEESNDIEIFTRLNKGKIPLTNAELVKALFLRRDGRGDISNDRKKEIAIQWDNIEKELHSEAFWFFLSNKTKGSFQTRIDLLLNLMVGAPEGCRDNYYTFFKFNEIVNSGGENVEKIWENIQHTFLTLKGWFNEHELYHKIGYLIASSFKPESCSVSMLQYVYEKSKGKTNTEFVSFLDCLIKDSIKLGSNKNYADLRYGKDNEKLKRLLLLFNVESVRQNGKQTQWFPFDKFKFDGTREEVWSLEHIHAQNSDLLNKQKDWNQWLESHIPFVQHLTKEVSSDRKDAIATLIEKMKSAQKKAASENNGALTTREFVDIYNEVMSYLPESKQNIDSISNLALLNVGNNAALSNSVFAVKRDKIIKMDMKGAFIPYCTKMVFLKYYSASDNNQLLFWGPEDRNSYIQKMNEVLAKYLENEIAMLSEEEME